MTERTEKIYNWLKNEWFPNNPPIEHSVTRKNLVIEYFDYDDEQPIIAKHNQRMSQALNDYKKNSEEMLMEKISLRLFDEDMDDKELYDRAVKTMYEDEGVYFIQAESRRNWFTPSFKELADHLTDEIKRTWGSLRGYIARGVATNPKLADGTDFRNAQFVSDINKLSKKPLVEPKGLSDEEAIFKEENFDKVKSLPDLSEEEKKKRREKLAKLEMKNVEMLESTEEE